MTFVILFDDVIPEKVALVFVINLFSIKRVISLQGKVKIDEDYRRVTEDS